MLLYFLGTQVYLVLKFTWYTSIHLSVMVFLLDYRLLHTIVRFIICVYNEPFVGNKMDLPIFQKKGFPNFEHKFIT